MHIFFSQNKINVTVVTCNRNFPDGKIYNSYYNKLYRKTNDKKGKYNQVMVFCLAEFRKIFQNFSHVTSAFLFLFLVYL